MGKGSSTRTGSYSDKIVDVHPHKDVTLPPISHFQAFFARFGPILTVYHQDNSRTSKRPDHTYVVFKNEGAVAKVKEYLAQKKNQDFWKQSCSMVTGIKMCPAGLMNAIKFATNDAPGPPAGSSKAGGKSSSGNHNAAGAPEGHDHASKPSNLKRTRRDQSSGADSSNEPNKRKKTTFEESSSSTSEQDPAPPYASPNRPRRNTDTNREPSPDLVTIKRELHTPSRLSVPSDDGPSASALELAQEAAELAAKSCSRTAKSSTPGGEVEELRAELERMKSKRDRIKSERDQLRAQRDEARQESEQYRAERDRAVEQREAETETCRELRRQVEKLKKALKEKDENSDKVLKLTIASLQSLRGSSSGRAGSET